MVRRAARSRLRRTKGAIVTLSTPPPPGSVTVCLDQMGPVAAKSDPGQAAVRPAPEGQAGRARQAIDSGRRGTGDVSGAFLPATGAALTVPDDGRRTEHGLDFRAQVAEWLPPAPERVDAIVDHLGLHRALDVLLFALASPRWECVFPPTAAADLTLIEPWWQGLRSLARTGRRFARWEEVCQAVAAATADWQAHRHPFVWGRRRRHRPRRRAGVGLLPKAA